MTRKQLRSTDPERFKEQQNIKRIQADIERRRDWLPPFKRVLLEARKKH